MAEQSATITALALRPETELILRCARTCVSDEGANRIAVLLRNDLDWDYLIQTALRHRVLPLIYRSLNNVCPEVVPRAALDQLRDYFHANALHNRLLTGELLKLLKLFESHGITAIPYKGPVLAVAAYGDLSLRQFSDLDILVHTHDVLKAKDLIISQGYHIQGKFADAGEAARSLSKKKDFGFVLDEGKVLVELHWRLAGKKFGYRPDMERLWRRANRMPLAGPTVLNISPEDLLEILCVHGSKHYWRRLEWMCDVAELVRANEQIDWLLTMEQARTNGCERMLFLGLCLASDLLGTVIPEEVSREVQNNLKVKHLANYVSQQAFRETNKRHSLIFYINTRERLRDRLRAGYYSGLNLLRNVIRPTGREQAILPLPRFLFFLYYLLRPLRLVAAHGARIVQSLLSKLKVA